MTRKVLLPVKRWIRIVRRTKAPYCFGKQLNSLKCRVLSKLAKKLLGIPATSAPIERVFSHTDNILRPNRARLLPDNFEQLVLLKVNSLC